MNLRSLTELFRLRDERREDVNYEISVSFYEVYNENLFDLLDTNRDKELKIRQGPTGVYVEGLVDRKVESEADVLQLVAEGSKNRTVASTSMNAGSSRSHSILSVQVHGHSSVMGVQLRGTLHLIDRQKHTHTHTYAAAFISCACFSHCFLCSALVLSLL